MTDFPAAHELETRSFPLGSGIAIVGAIMMVVGAWGPWIGGKFFGATDGLDLGGDGWLVVAAAALAMLPLVLPLPPSALKGVWVIALAIGAAYVCWQHYAQADIDGFTVVWGLDVSAVGSGLLGLAGLRLLLPRR